jgi:hypothetical protein
MSLAHRPPDIWDHSVDEGRSCSARVAFPLDDFGRIRDGGRATVLVTKHAPVVTGAEHPRA